MDDWPQYQKLVLSELKRLSESQESTREAVGEVHTRVAVMESSIDNLSQKLQTKRRNDKQETTSIWVAVVAGVLGLLGTVIQALITVTKHQ